MIILKYISINYFQNNLHLGEGGGVRLIEISNYSVRIELNNSIQKKRLFIQKMNNQK